jgi:phosphate transport system permease protein
MASATIADPGAFGLGGDPKRRRRERRVHAVFFSAASVSVLISVLIVVSLVGRAFDFLSRIEPSWLLGDVWAPRSNQFSIPAIFSASLIVGGIAMLVAAPLGLGAAIYLSEYARPRARRAFKPALELLAGVPSIVLAFFALTVISPEVIQQLFPTAGLFNMASAGIAVGILTVPLVATIAEDAMHAVPAALREASYGLGAQRKTTSMRIVFPAAVSGIVAALIVGLARALGETMVVAIAAGGTGNGVLRLSPLQPGVTATAAMATLATGTDQVKGAGAAFPSLFFVGLLLFIATLSLNVLSERFVRRVRQRY